MIEVAGTWELGWSAPKTEMDLWWSVMRSYNLERLHMTPVSGIKHKMLIEYGSWEELLEKNSHLRPVYVDEDGQEEADDFPYGDNMLLIFGKANYSPAHTYGKDAESIRIDCPTPGMLWPHQALAIVMHEATR